MAKLTFVLEQGEEVVVPLVDAATWTLGRGDDNDVVVDDARVSTHHACLERREDGSIEVCDLGSTAGTFVNGQRVRRRCSIQDGDTLAFGPLTAVFDLEGLPPGPRRQRLERAGGKRSAASRPGRAGVRGSRQTGAALEEDLPARHAAAREELARMAAEKTRLLEQVEAAQGQLRSHAQEHHRLLGEIATAQAGLRSWQERATREMGEHAARVDALHAEEQRLAGVKTAVAAAEALHQQWAEAVQALSAEHEARDLEAGRLLAAEATARHEVEALAAQQDQERARLRQLQAERQHDEAHLAAQRQHLTALEDQSQRAEELAAARADQVTLAEKKLAELAERRTRLEAHVKELAGMEEKLEQALTRKHEADAQHSALRAAIGMLDTRKQGLEAAAQTLEARASTLREEVTKAAAALADTHAAQRRTEQTLDALQADIQARQEELAAETTRLQDATSRRAEIIQQCEDLAETRQELAEVDAALAAAEQRQNDMQEAITAKERELQALTAAVTTATAEEEAAAGRLESLRGRENELLTELEKLAAAEHSTRARFEEIRQLIIEGEAEQQALDEEHAQKVNAHQQELRALEAKLVPLRDWKEAMDQLYARLAELPQDSPEARELWREIEKEKEDLKNLISTARSQARGATLKKPGWFAAKKPQEVIPDSVIILDPIEDPAPGAAAAAVQERTLKSRLNHLRESVLREESRLEFLRQERGRQEVRARSRAASPAPAQAPPPGPETATPEHARSHDDEGQLSAPEPHIGQAKGEEEKRRARITEMEHKLADLQTAITEAERHRSELRQQADLAHTELKNFQATLERVRKGKADAARR